MRAIASVPGKVTEYGQIDHVYYLTQKGRVLRTGVSSRSNVLMWIDVLSDDNALELLDLGQDKSFFFSLLGCLTKTMNDEVIQRCDEIEEIRKSLAPLRDSRAQIGGIISLLS